MNISDIRQKFPQYEDLSDKELADALHAKFYPDIPLPDFYDKVGLRKSGLLAAAGKGIEGLLSSGRTAIESLTGSPEEAARRALARGKETEAEYADQVSLDKVKKAYAERGLLPAAGEAISQIPAAIAEQLPNIGATVAGARAGQAAGSMFGPYGRIAGATVGALAPSLLQQYGGNIERQAAEAERTGQPLQINRGAAAMAAAPQAALDVAGTLIPFGGRLVSKLTGIPAEALLGKSAAQAAKLADEKLLSVLAKGTAVGALAEIPTEIAQQMLERAQAGLSLTSPDALKEYGETAYQVGLLAPIGAVGRLSERAGAREEVRNEQEKAAREKRLAQIQEEEAARAEEAQKAAILAKDRETPDYALRFGEEYDAMLAQYKDLRGQLKKPGKDATPEEQVAYKDLQSKVKDLHKQLTSLTPEYQRIKPLFLQTKAQQAEQERVAGMTPMDYMLEQTGEVPEPTAKPVAPDMAGLEFVEPETPTSRREAEAKRQAAVPTTYAAERMQLARDQMVDPTGADFVEYLLADPYKASLLVETRTPLPGLSQAESSLIRNTLASQLKKQAKTELEQRQGELKGQVPGKTQGNPMAQFLADQDMMDVARQEGMTESEIREMERLSKMPVGTVTQGDLFGETRVGQAAGVKTQETLANELAALQKKLDVAVSQRNVNKGMQYRETIRSLIEQMRDLRSKIALPTTGEMGKQTAELQGMLGQAPEALRQQQEAQAQREQLLTKLANGEDNRFDILDGLVNEIKSVRGELKPETITDIEKEAAPLLDAISKYGEGYVPDVAAELNAIAQKWRGGTERGETFTTTATPTQTSEDMLRKQIDVAYANRDRYDADTQAVLDRIADNLGPVMVDPERRNLIGEWLHDVTVQSRQGRMPAGPQQRYASSLTKDVTAELDRLESGKLQENGQLELPSRMLPKEVEGKAPVQTATAFDTAAEFQKFLASEGLQSLRSSMGLNVSTASRMHQRMELYRKKYEGIIASAQKQLDALNKRKAELETSKTQESRTAKELLADAQIRLNNVIDRLQAELQDLQVAYIQADLQRAASAKEAADIAAQIAANVVKFDATNLRAIEASQAAADAKAELARIMQMPVNKKTFSAMRKAQQAVTEAVRAQRSASASLSPALKRFLAEDEKLQLQLTEANEKAEADARTLVEAKAALDAEAARQKRRLIYKQEFKSAQANLAAALELSGPELAKITGSINAELSKVEADLAAATAAKRVAEGKLSSKAQPSAFEQKLASIKIEPMSAAEREAIAARDKAERENFEATAARLNAIPGTAIDFTKRREMIELLKVSDKQKDELAQKIKDVDTGIEEMQIAAAIAEDALADTEAGYTPEQKAKFQERIKQANERIAQLQAYGKRLEAQQVKLEAAYAKAALATSSEPEIYTQVTKDIDDRIEKLNKNIAENESRIAKGEAKSGGKAETKTLQQARKRLAGYKRELKGLEALRSNRLGIQRRDAVTGEKISEQVAAERRAEQGRAEPQKRMDLATQEAIDAENDRAEKYSERTARLLQLQNAQAAMQAAKEPKTEAKKAERAEKLRKLQEDINKQIDLVNEVLPKGVGKVSAAARIQTSAPGKFRTGTAESKETAGVTKQPIVEKREVAQPTPTKAVEDANEFATRLEQAKDRKTLVAEAAAKSAAQQEAIVAALDDNVRRYEREVAKLEAERDTLQDAIDTATENDSPIPATTAERLKTVREQLSNYNQALTRAQFAKADLEAAQEAAAPAQPEAVEKKQPKVSADLKRKLDMFENDTDDRLPQLAALNASGPALAEPVDTEQSAAAVMANIAKTTTDPINKALAERLKMLLGNTRIELVDDLKLDDGQPALGAATSDGLLIELDRRLGLGETTALHEGVHAATERVLAMPEDQLTESQLNAKRELQAMYDALKADPDFKNQELLANLSEFAAESLTNPVLRNYMQQKKWTLKYMWDAFKSAILKLLGVQTPRNMSEAAIAAVDRLMTKVPRPTAADFNLTVPATRLPRLANSELAAALATANKMVAKQRTWSDKIKANSSGLAFETQLVDRFAGFERIAKTMDKLSGMQMMYYLRMYDQRMNFVSQSVANGALQLKEVTRADGRKEYVIESEPGSSLRGVAEILRGASGITGSVDNTSRLFTMYLAALRAERVGFEKLNFGKDLSKQEVMAAMRSIQANAQLESVFKQARNEYNAYNEGLVRFAQRTGALSKETADALLSSKDYIPYYRERNGNVELLIGGEEPIRIGSIKEQPYLKDLVGGDTAILDFMTSSVQNTNMLTDMALRNLATKNAIMELVEMDMAKLTTTVTSGPDVVKFKVNGEDRYAMIDTDKAGVPADLLVKGMEGIPAQMPAVLRLAAAPAKLLRKAVTLSPLYAARQLFRDSLAAPLLAGADFAPVMGALKEIGAPAGKTLERRGVIGGQIFTGTQEDLTAIMRRIASGKGGWQDWVSKFETVSMEADALTRRAQYNSYIKQGLSEMEATLMSLESMNFNKRGASPSVHMANSLIPFFNAQIQSLNVLYKAMTGKLPFNEKLKIQEKLLTRGLMIAAGTLAYAAMMQDDEAYKNATPDQKYGNWFVRIPGLAEPIKLPIPFEIGYIFKALPEALYNSMTTKHGGEEAVKAMRQILLSTIPGGTSYGIPQALRPAIEAGLGKSFYTGRDILSPTEKGLLPEAQFRENTSELAKAFGKMTGTSPIALEELVRGYTGTMGLVFLQAVSAPFQGAGSPEKAAKRLSDMPVVGGVFQPNDAGGIINATFDKMNEYVEVQKTVDNYIRRGEVAKAKELIAQRGNEYAMSEVAGTFTKSIQELTQYETAIKASNLSPEEKRAKLDEVRRMKIRLAETVRSATDRTTPR